MRWYEVKRERAVIVKDNSQHAFRWVSLEQCGDSEANKGKVGCWEGPGHSAQGVRKSKTVLRNAGVCS